ncbi:MAG: hypothetical protein Tsb009_36180 [Planctomycetaceae bacterium]
MILRIPDEVYLHSQAVPCLTLRQLVSAAGVNPALIVMWSLQGMTYQIKPETTPLLDQVIPAAPPGSDPNIVVWLNTPVQQAGMASPPASGFSLPASQSGLKSSADLSDVFDVIETNWHAIVQIEKQLKRLRKQLSSMISRLGSLNRDLGPDERLHANRQDKSDWQVARRWLRDVANRISQSVKAFDIGENSNAGQRNYFQQIYEQYIAPRKPFEGIHQTEREFETYRKGIQTLQATMNNALQTAVQDGERRATQILSRIAASVRAANSKRG